LFDSTPEGLPGDEDNGSLSAWYIFAAMGIYPLCPGVPEYVLGSPLFDRLTLNLESGKQIVIEASNNGKENRYVRSVSLNGLSHPKLYVTHDQLMDGCVIGFQMSDNAGEDDIEDENLPFSLSGI
jgi:putative alpha-1,2-mannosidase